MFTRIGYYILERKAMAEKIPDNAKVLSIVEFLRKASKRDIEGRIFVYGLDEVARIWHDTPNFSRYLRDKLRYLASIIFTKGCIITFIVEGKIIGEAKPMIKQHDIEIDLISIFGADRLEKLRDSCFYSPPNIP